MYIYLVFTHTHLLIHLCKVHVIHIQDVFSLNLGEYEWLNGVDLCVLLRQLTITIIVQKVYLFVQSYIVVSELMWPFVVITNEMPFNSIIASYHRRQEGHYDSVICHQSRLTCNCIQSFVINDDF